MNATLLLAWAAICAEPQIAKARAWLDQLTIDPIELRRHGIKGKKKLVELLDAYALLDKQATDGADRAAIRKRIAEVAKVTAEERYHDMLLVPDGQFKEDATSYLRAAVLLDRFGFDITRYRAEIKKIGARLNEHMKLRGPNQRRIFHTYYTQFGLKEPFPLERALEHGIIARRADPAKMGLIEAYDLTHEIYGVYEFGEKLHIQPDPWSKEDRLYLRTTLDTLAERYAKPATVDIAAELVTCAAYLEMKDSAAYRTGLDLLHRTQNEDGTWGSYEAEQKKLGEWVKPGFYLHTTLVVIGALVAAR